MRDFTPGPELSDHIVVRAMTSEDLRFSQTEGGTVVSWDVEAGSGSIMLEGVNLPQLSRDDFMFTDIEGGDLLPSGRTPAPPDFTQPERNASEAPPEIGEATIERGTAKSSNAIADGFLNAAACHLMSISTMSSSAVRAATRRLARPHGVI